MRRIAIAGAGQAGLQLGLGLLAAGYEVTLVTARTPGEVRGGPVLSTQAMFGPALRIEAAAGLDLWAGQVPRVGAVRSVLVAQPGERTLEFTMRPDEPVESVDQRVKMASWLELLEERGGRVEYRTLDAAGLARLAARHELTVVATGRGGEPAALFERDPRRSRHEAPLRTIACLYAHGVGSPDPATEPAARMHALPGLGELYLQPALTRTGPCSILLWEALPGSALDCFADRPGPREQVNRIRQVLAEYLPWEAELWAGAVPTDRGAGLYGAVTPTVRRPVAEAAPGLPVLGIADTVVLNDPITGQGANSAARAAEHYLGAIRARGAGPFDEDWMHAVFEEFWQQHARHTVDFTTAMLTMPDHLQAVFAAAPQRPAVARRFANTYAEPADYANWLAEPALTEAYLAQLGAT
ncbi:styrene monooxygenase/indole monooxygenase family protein [Kitasatospora sp. NPDC006697]|uniref:styrene monooxygenase/indole monooxygenase family protein n=1 Tax=Kitasatospora sp. NPDC006697 TaxID=3364020 RepID=UPI0036B84431